MNETYCTNQLNNKTLEKRTWIFHKIFLRKSSSDVCLCVHQYAAHHKGVEGWRVSARGNSSANTKTQMKYTSFPACVWHWIVWFFLGGRRDQCAWIEERNLKNLEYSSATTKDSTRWTYTGRWQSTERISTDKKQFQIDSGDKRARTIEGCHVQNIQKILLRRTVGGDGKGIHVGLGQTFGPVEPGRFWANGRIFLRTRSKAVRWYVNVRYCDRDISSKSWRGEFLFGNGIRELT